MFFALLSLLPATAQTDDLKAKYDAFKRQAKQEYDDFRGEANKKYAEFLRQTWAEFETQPSIPKPKKDTVPPAIVPDKDRGKAVEDRPVEIDIIISPPQPEPQPLPVSPIKEQPVTEEKTVTFAFYGTPCRVRFNSEEDFSVADCTNETVAGVWKKFSDRIDNTVRDCLDLRVRLQLGDWAYLDLLETMAEACVDSGNAATLLAAYVYCQSGYEMRLGRMGDELELLFTSRHLIYGMPYLMIDGKMFYVRNPRKGGMSVCNVSFPGEAPLSLLLYREPQFVERATSPRTLASKRYPEVSLRVELNKNTLDFYNTYPASRLGDDEVTAWAMYADKPMERGVQDKLYPALLRHIDGLSQLEAVNRLLDWVQTALVYGYDEEIWGGERAFFAEETLFYPYSDCEDRSILFSRLVRDLLGLDVLLVYYPGHLATAVCFTETVQGDYIMYNGLRFVVCDPTYIGASAGQTMPDLDNAAAQVILLSNDRSPSIE